MNVTLRTPLMTREQFLDWNEGEEAPFEFNGREPVAMPSRTVGAARICGNICYQLCRRIENAPTEVFMRMGVATTDNAVRYPDILITQTPGRGSDRLVEGALALFDVMSPDPGQAERLARLTREFLTVSTIHRYVVVEQTKAALTAFERDETGSAWRTTELGAGKTLDLPEFGVSLALADIYRGVDLPTSPIG